MANTRSQTPMETAPGAYENPKTKEQCNIKRMIIAYKHPMNLRNLLSHRDLATGPPLSRHIYMIRDIGGLCVCLVCVFSVCV